MLQNNTFFINFSVSEDFVVARYGKWNVRTILLCKSKTKMQPSKHLSSGFQRFPKPQTSPKVTTQAASNSCTQVCPRDPKATTCNCNCRWLRCWFFFCELEEFDLYQYDCQQFISFLFLQNIFHIESNWSRLLISGYNFSSKEYLSKAPKPAVIKIKQCHNEWYIVYVFGSEANKYIERAVKPHERRRKDWHLKNNKYLHIVFHFMTIIIKLLSSIYHVNNVFWINSYQRKNIKTAFSMVNDKI